MTEVERRSSILLGEAYLHVGRMDQACLAFAAAGYIPGLVACGQQALKESDWHYALWAFLTSRHVEGLLACGQQALKEGSFDAAKLALQAAGVQMSREDVIACGYAALQARRFPDAAEAFKAAGYTPGLVACGRQAIKEGAFHAAELALQAAGVSMSREDVIACGYAALNGRRFVDAGGAFQAARFTAGLISYGNRALEEGHEGLARAAFEAAAEFEQEDGA